MKRLTTFTFVLVAAVAVAGCGGASTSQTEADDDEHHEHHVASYRPVDLGDTVYRLKRRHRRVVRAVTSGSTDEGVYAVEELLDIARWLPEIAADTDLRKREWDRVRDVSVELTALYEPVHTAMTSGGQPDLSSAEEQLPALLETLRETIAVLDDMENETASPGSEGNER